jgi:hypothetical protein
MVLNVLIPAMIALMVFHLDLYQNHQKENSAIALIVYKKVIF